MGESNFWGTGHKIDYSQNFHPNLIGRGRTLIKMLEDTQRTIGPKVLLVKPVIVDIYKYRRNRHNFKDTHHPQF